MKIINKDKAKYKIRQYSELDHGDLFLLIDDYERIDYKHIWIKTNEFKKGVIVNSGENGTFNLTSSVILLTDIELSYDLEKE